VTRHLSFASTVVLVLVVSVACGSGSGGTPGSSIGPGSSGSPGPAGSPPAVMSEGELRVALVERFGPRWWCDSDFYPLARDDEQVLAVQRFGEMQAEADVFGAVVDQLGLGGATTLTDAQKLAIYQLWKAARSFPFESVGNGRYRFDYVAQPPAGGAEGTETTGTISETGEIAIDQQVAAGEPNCPICLARGTLIDTPVGPVAVDALHLGEAIWTFDAGGHRVVGTVVALGSTAAPAAHEVVHVILADGRTVTASRGHPLADGRPLGALRIGDVVDGSRVTAADLLPYDGGDTFDLVASGPTGGYFAGGIPMGSTIAG
jgi:hypothetical protein